MSANLKRAVKRIKAKLNADYETAQATPTAGPVGTGKAFIAGQVFDGAISGVTQVVNVGRPAAAQYAPKVGGSVTVVSGGGGSTTTTGSTTALTSIAFLTLEADATLTNERYLAVSDALTKTDGGAGAALTLGLATPGSLSVSSTNVATGAHTHAIASSSNPGAAASLLASDSSGFLTLPKFVASTKMTTPTIDTASGTLSLRPANATAQVVGALRSTYNTTDGGGAVVQGILDSGNSFARAWFGHNAKYDLTADQWNIDNVGANDTSGLLLRNGAAAIDFIFHASTGATSRTMDHSTFTAGAKFTMTSAGRFGVLNTSPTYELDVAGSIRATTSLISPVVTTVGSGVDLTLSPIDDIVLNPGSNIVKLSTSNVLQSDNYASQTTGMRITHDGQADFRYLFVDEMHAKSFIADLEQALAGGQIIAKSVAVLYSNFTAPAASGSTTITVRDLPSATGMACFQNNDYIRVRNFSRSGGSLDISDCWGTVTLDTSYGTSGFDSATKTQRYTFTRSASPNAGAMTSGTIVYADAIILDYGTSGNGFYEVNAIDGLNAANSPYAQIVTWATHPRTQTVRARLGNLYGIFAQSGEYGLYAGDGTADTNQYLRISSSSVRLNNIPLRLHNGGTQTVNIDSAGTNIWVGPSSADKRLSWNGTTLSVVGAIEITSPSNFSGSGYLQVGTGTKDSSLNGWNMSSSEFVGQSSGVDQVVMGTNGRITAGAGAVWLDVDGINFAVEPADVSPSYLRFMNGSTVEGSIGYFFTAGPTPGSSDGMNFYATTGHKFRFTGASLTEFSSTVNVTGYVTATSGMSVGGTAVSLEGHTHSGYLSTSGGTLTGTLTGRDFIPSADNTYDIGSATYRVQDLYAVNLHVNNVVGTPTYSHSHDAADITSGTLAFARIPTTWSGALNLDADANAGSSNYVRWTTQTGSKNWDLVARAFDYATTPSQQNDLLLTYFDGTTLYSVFQADSATRVIDFAQTPTVGGTAVSLSNHNHDTAYVPLARTVTAGAGLTGGGALSANITISHLDTSSQASVTNTTTNLIQSVTLDTYGHVTALASADVAALLDDRYVNVTGDTMTGNLTVAKSSARILLDNTDTTQYSSAALVLRNDVQAQDVEWYIFAEKASAGAATGASTLQVRKRNSAGSVALTPIVINVSNDIILNAGYSTGGATYGNVGVKKAPSSSYSLDVSGSMAASTSVLTPTVTTVSGNLSLTSAGGTVAVTGALTGSSTGVFTSTLTAASDTDAINTFGRVRLGYAAATDTASFSHFDNNTSANFALSQSATGATTVNAASGQTVRLSNAGVTVATVGASGIDLQPGEYIGSSDFASRQTGWRADQYGGGDFRYLYTDQLHAKSFIADLQQALAGSQVISKSVAVLAEDFIAPYAGGSQLLVVEDLPSASNMAVFEANDIVTLKTFSRSSGSLSIGYCFGVVTNYTDGTGTQTWTFTRSGTTTYNAITQRGTATSSSTASGTSVTVTKPTGVVSGDVMLAVVTHDGTADTITATGWTIIGTYTSGTDINFAMYYRVAGGAEGANYSFSTVSTHALAASIVAYYNVDSLILDDYSISNNSASTNMTGTTVFGTATANMLVFLGGITNNSAVTPAAGMTELVDAGSTGIRVYVAQQTLTASGETGSKVATIAASHASIVGMVALRPTYSAMTQPAGTIAPGTVMEADGLVLDYGVSGNGIYEVSAIDGPYASYAPYARVATFTTHPLTDGVVRTQMGNLSGLSGASANEYGLYAGSGTIATTAQYLRISTAGVQLNNIPIKLYNAGTQTVNIDSAGTDIWVGTSSSDKRLQWNGTSLNLNNSAGTAVITFDNSGGSYFAGPMTIGTSGGIYQGSGTFASPTTGLKIWNDTSIGRIGGYNGGTLQWYANTDGKLYAGGGNVVLDSAGISTIGGSSFIIKQDSATTKGYVYSSNPLDSLLVNSTGVGIKTAAVATTESISLRANASGGRSSEIAIEGSGSTNRIRMLVYSGSGATSGQLTLAETSFSVALNGTGTNDFSIDGTSAQFNTDVDLNGNDIIDIGNVVGNISTWTTLTLNTAGNWANYGGSYFNAAYKKIGDLVFLRGLVKRTSGTNTLIATMPVDYRPTSYILRSTSGDDAFARIDIENDGEIRMQAGAAAVYISLDGLWFSTA